MKNYSMPRYFQGMPVVGKPIPAANEENKEAIKKVEKEIEAITEKEIKSTEDLFVMKEKEIMSI